MNGLTDIPGIRVGHWTHAEAATGCTVVLCPEGAIGGVDVRGTAPGTRETDLLDAVCAIEHLHAVVLAGGSAFGLAAADGVMRWLEERGHGFRLGRAVVPIVPAAVLFDLAVGRADIRPDAAAGYAACENARDEPVPGGNVGAGTGASAGKLFGPQWATKSGLGSSARTLRDGLIVAALAAANPFGDIVDPLRQAILAGTRLPEGGFADSLRQAERRQSFLPADQGANTTLAIVATNASLTKAQATKMAQMAQDGLARVLRPAHTHFDGDAIFALSLGSHRADISLLGALAAEVVAEAIVDGTMSAEALAGLPAARDLLGLAEEEV